MTTIYCFGIDQESGKFTCLSRQIISDVRDAEATIARERAAGREVYEYDGPTSGSQGSYPVSPQADLADALRRAADPQ